MVGTRRAGLAVALVALLTATGLVLGEQDRTGGDAPVSAPSSPSGAFRGQVVDETGRPVPGAGVVLDGRLIARTGRDGRFAGGSGTRPRLLTVHASGHLPRVQAAQPGVPVEIEQTRDTAGTVSLRFGGDVMFGRRFYDPDEDGDTRDGLLRPGASVADHAGLLDAVRPLLGNADLTVVNYETPVQPDPVVDPTRQRPAAYHPTKEFVFASAPASAVALRRAGVDLVSLGNNHVFDALAPGLDLTLRTLDAAGLPHFGAGRTLDEAWAPAFVERRGGRFAFLACTTITGREHAIAYVADASRGGAAPCERGRLAREVRRARAAGATVVVMVHGGEEYQARQTAVVRDLSAVAADAGAALVVDGHPHVVGGLARRGDALVAETMGNLLFDQTVWPTFLSYLLRVDLRDGRPLHAAVDPLLISGFVPHPAVGPPADTASRRAAGLVPGPAVLGGAGAVVQGTPPAQAHSRAGLVAGVPRRLAPGWYVAEPVPAGTGPAVRIGEDLLWGTGGFETTDTDPDTTRTALWSLGTGARATKRARCAGSSGVDLERGPASEQDVVLTPAHRQLVTAGTSLSLLVDVRGASAGATVELALFPDTEGPSSRTLSVRVPTGEHRPGACRQVRVDTVVPAGTVAVQPLVRLAAPPGVVRGAHLDVDDVRLVQWAGRANAGRRYDTVEATADTAVELTGDRPVGPGARPPLLPGGSTPGP